MGGAASGVQTRHRWWRSTSVAVASQDVVDWRVGVAATTR